MATVIESVLLLAGLFLSAFLFNLALRLTRVDVEESDKSASRVANSLRKAVTGRALSVDDWLPDARVKAGLVYNKNAKRLEISGRLSNESFGRIFRR